MKPASEATTNTYEEGPLKSMEAQVESRAKQVVCWQPWHVSCLQCTKEQLIVPRPGVVGEWERTWEGPGSTEDSFRALYIHVAGRSVH